MIGRASDGSDRPVDRLARGAMIQGAELLEPADAEPRLRFVVGAAGSLSEPNDSLIYRPRLVPLPDDAQAVGRPQQGECRIAGIAARQQFIREPAELLRESRKLGGLGLYTPSTLAAASALSN